MKLSVDKEGWELIIFILVLTLVIVCSTKAELPMKIDTTGMDTVEWRTDTVDVHVGGSWPCQLLATGWNDLHCIHTDHYQRVPKYVSVLKPILDTTYLLTREQLEWVKKLPNVGPGVTVSISTWDTKRLRFPIDFGHQDSGIDSLETVIDSLTKRTGCLIYDGYACSGDIISIKSIDRCQCLIGIAMCVADKDGYYSFCLYPGEYNVLIRGRNLESTKQISIGMRALGDSTATWK